MNCNVEDLDGEKDSFIFAEAWQIQEDDLLFVESKTSTMGKSIIVSATPKLLKYVKEQLAEKSRDEVN